MLNTKCRKCSTCGLPVSKSAWTDGATADTQPRSLYGIDGTVLLVSVIYTCDAHHRTLAHDATILGSFPSQNIIPFVLFHRTGFTRQLVTLCMSLAHRCMSFLEIETFLLEKRWEAHAAIQEISLLHKSEAVQDPDSHDTYPTSVLCKSPSDTLIRKCFLAYFLANEKSYIREMYKVSIGESISFDHTFKVASNVGYLREDKVWIPLYDSLFIVMNREGKIVTWQFTKGTSFTQIEQCLHSIHTRAHSSGVPITSVYVDDCCKSRNKIKSIFGNETLVKLDIFHATQRIIKTLSKRHNSFQKCIHDFQLVFRENGDSGSRRMRNTPVPDAMLKNLERFEMKWKAVKNNDDKPLFSQATTQAISNLKQHIRHGCLSDIPPGCGTNRNERFHCHMNSLIRRSRIGVLLAYALISIVMYSHNSTVKFKGKTLVKPISCAASLQRSVKNHVDLPSFGLCPKVRHQQGVSDSYEIDISDCEIDIDLIKCLYKTSVTRYYLTRSLLSLNLPRLKELVIKFEPFKHQSFDESLTRSYSDTMIYTRLSEYGLKICESARDGNCFFMSVAVSLSHAKELGTGVCAILGVSANLLENPIVLSKLLRQKFVEELQSEHCHNYTAFLVHDELLNWEEEVLKYKQDGFFASAIGDLLPIVISNILHLNIIIFKTVGSPPTMFVSPCDEITNIGTIFLVYDPLHSGHYDAALKCINYEEGGQCTKTVKKMFNCSCGVNASGDGKKSCKLQPHYASRCNCYKNSVSCSAACRCKNCNNPFGSRPQPSERKRNRRMHLMQHVDIPSAKRFAQERKEILTETHWSDFETIVLSEVAKQVESSNCQSIQKVYNDVVYYSTALFCTNPLSPDIVFRRKTQEQIQAKLKYILERYGTIAKS